MGTTPREPVLNITLNDDAEPTIFDLGGGVIVTLESPEHGRVQHPCPDGYWRPSHSVGIDFAQHTLVSRRPLTITPSLHCDRASGGCGWHVFITNGKVV